RSLFKVTKEQRVRKPLPSFLDSGFYSLPHEEELAVGLEEHILGVITIRLMGSPGPTNLSPTQVAFYRTGHAHAGVLTLLALLRQIAVDYAAVLVPGGFFAVAHRRSLCMILYTGAVLVAATNLTVGVGLIRSR